MITNPSALNLAIPVNKIDQIIGIRPGTFNVAAPTPGPGSPSTASTTFDTGFGDTCLFQGIFSVDGGASWNDFGSFKPNLTTPGQPVLQTVTCRGAVSPTGIFTANATNYYDGVHFAGTAYTVQYKVAFLAKDDQGAITPIRTNEILYYNSKYNFQKIFLSSSFANNVGVPTTITHSLGYVPKVRAWGTSTTGGSFFTPGSMLSYDVFGGGNFNMAVSTTNVVFDAITTFGTVNVFYRIYLDS